MSNIFQYFNSNLDDALYAPEENNENYNLDFLNPSDDRISLAKLAAQNEQNYNPSILNQTRSKPQSAPEEEILQNTKEEYNPYKGAQKAVEFAENSLGITKNQRDKALRKSLFAFGEHIGKTPIQRGFQKNLGTILQALAPAVNAYDDIETQATAENRALFDKINAYKRQEALDERQRMLDERTAVYQDWKQNLAERKFALDQNALALKYSDNQEQNIPEEYRDKPELTRVNQNELQKASPALDSAIYQITEIKKNLKEFEKKTANNLFKGFGSLTSKNANKVKDYLAKVNPESNLAKEVDLRKKITMKFGKVITNLETALDGGGKIGQGMYDRLSKFFPNFEDDSVSLIKDNLDDFLKEAIVAKKAADESLKYNKLVGRDKYYEEYEEGNNSKDDLFDQVFDNLRLIEK